MSSEPDRAPDPGDAPRLAERCPALTAEILALAIHAGEHPLALAIHEHRQDHVVRDRYRAAQRHETHRHGENLPPRWRGAPPSPVTSCRKAPMKPLTNSPVTAAMTVAVSQRDREPMVTAQSITLTIDWTYPEVV
jgi:hypothetical protein